MKTLDLNPVDKSLPISINLKYLSRKVAQTYEIFITQLKHLIKKKRWNIEAVKMSACLHECISILSTHLIPRTVISPEMLNMASGFKVLIHIHSDRFHLT